MEDIRISPEACAKLMAGERVVFLDTRNPKAWAASDEHLPGAIRAPADAVEDYLDKISQGATVIAYCT